MVWLLVALAAVLVSVALLVVARCLPRPGRVRGRHRLGAVVGVRRGRRVADLAPCHGQVLTVGALRLREHAETLPMYPARSAGCVMDVDALRTARLVVLGLDTTTGTPPLITEAAVIYLDGGTITAGPFAYWAQPDAPMKHVPHRCWATVRLAPPWSELAGQVTEAVTGRLVVTHDPSRLDVLRRHLPDWEPTGVVHTRHLAEQVWPGLEEDDYALGPVTVHARINHVPRVGPGAVVEAHAVALLLAALLRDANRQAH